MAWETRPRGGRYYTRSHKVGGRVVREYVGVGLLAELAAALDAAERRERAAEAARWRGEAARFAALDEATAALDGLAEALASAAMVAHGYRRHNRGEWRKRRDHQED